MGRTNRLTDSPLEVRRKPACRSAVMAFKEPARFEEQITVGNYRYTVVHEITRAEFEAQTEENQVSGRGGVSGETRRGDPSKPFRPAARPGPGYQYFYRVAVELLPDYKSKGAL